MLHTLHTIKNVHMPAAYQRVVMSVYFYRQMHRIFFFFFARHRISTTCHDLLNVLIFVMMVFPRHILCCVYSTPIN